MKTLYFLLAFITLVACSKMEDVKNVKEYNGPFLEADSIETLYSDSAVVRVKLKAQKQFNFINDDKEFPEGIYIEFYEIDGSLSSTLLADRGYYKKQENLYTAKGNVVVKSLKEKNQLNSEELHWKPAEKKIFTDKFVRIETEDGITMGQGLEASQDFKTYTILKVTGEFDLKDQQSSTQ